MPSGARTGPARRPATRPVFCRCPVASWRELRYALALRQSDMAEILGLTISSVAELERGGRAGRSHRCPRDVYLERLRDYLRLPELRRRLEAAGHPHPWPEDA